jgi:hypothetical protein
MRNLFIGVMVCSLGILSSCGMSNTSPGTPEKTQTTVVQPTTASGKAPSTTTDSMQFQSYIGVVDGVSTSLEYNDAKYRMTQGDKVIEGDFNTERGFGTDDNATVFVLNAYKPAAEQTRFVRTSTANQKSIILVKDGKIDEKSVLVLDQIDTYMGTIQ